VEKYKIKDILDTIICGDVLEELKKFPDECVDCIITSPPYWGLRDYGETTYKIWGGDQDCNHEWIIEETRRPNASGGKTDYAKQKLAIKGTENYSEFVDYHNRVTKSFFCKKCGAWYGQLGLEPTLDLYLVHLWEITDELWRVLKKTGVMFWDHGDSYSGNMGKRNGWSYVSGLGNKKDGTTINFKAKYSIPQKCLCFQNYRLILGMIDIDYRILVEWRAMGKPEGKLEEMLKHPKIQRILRNQIIWYKPNHLPSSVKDRFTNAYEPIFMLVKSKKYWFDLDAVRVPHKESSYKRAQYSWKHSSRNEQATPPYTKKRWNVKELKYNFALGKNPGDIWEIPTQPFPEAHFATFPEKLVEPMIKAGCPQWICKKCGKARERIIKGTSPCAFGLRQRDTQKGRIKGPQTKASQKEIQTYNEKETFVGEGKITLGWTDCGCNAGWEAGIVLDPFMGSGTTALVAKKLGRHFIGIELNPEYVKMAYRRLEKEIPLFVNKI